MSTRTGTALGTSSTSALRRKRFTSCHASLSMDAASLVFQRHLVGDATHDACHVTSDVTSLITWSETQRVWRSLWEPWHFIARPTREDNHIPAGGKNSAEKLPQIASREKYYLTNATNNGGAFVFQLLLFPVVQNLYTSRGKYLLHFCWWNEESSAAVSTQAEEFRGETDLFTAGTSGEEEGRP